MIHISNQKKVAAMAVASITLAAALFACAAQELPTGPRNEDLRHLTNNKVLIRVGGKSFTVTLYDNPTAKDLLTRLPMTLTANNYAGYDEKVIRLSKSLSMKGAPPGDDPRIPEIGYYEPGRWIALYYGPIGYWAGKVPLGQIDARIEELRDIRDNAAITIEEIRK